MWNISELDKKSIDFEPNMNRNAPGKTDPGLFWQRSQQPGLLRSKHQLPLVPLILPKGDAFREMGNLYMTLVERVLPIEDPNWIHGTFSAAPSASKLGLVNSHVPTFWFLLAIVIASRDYTAPTKIRAKKPSSTSLFGRNLTCFLFARNGSRGAFSRRTSREILWLGVRLRSWGS